MSGISRKDIDSAGGTFTSGSSDVFINGHSAVRVGDSVMSHPGGFPHNKPPVMVTGSSTVFVNGKPLCRAGDSAECGHKASGSIDTFAG